MYHTYTCPHPFGLKKMKVKVPEAFFNVLSIPDTETDRSSCNYRPKKDIDIIQTAKPAN